jgi:phage repressor protein C with HTH and peptisase S24 domain
LLAKLETVLGFDTGLLLRIAHLERMPADIRKAFEDAQAENQQWRALAQKAVQAGGDLRELLASPDYGHLLEAPMENTESAPIAGKLIPVINKVPAGYPADFDDLGYPPGAADDYVRCPDLHDAHAFAVRVVGDSMEPKYREGDIVIFSPARQVENGDDCFVRMTDPHETTFKQIFFDDKNSVRLQPRNQKYSPMTLERNRISAIWKAVSRYEHLE